MNLPTGMTKTSQPLKPSERKWTIALVLIGAVLVVGVLAVYLANTNGVLLGEDGTKEYPDTLVLAVVGTGVLVILCGAFYVVASARLRSRVVRG